MLESGFDVALLDCHSIQPWHCEMEIMLPCSDEPPFLPQHRHSSIFVVDSCNGLELVSGCVERPFVIRLWQVVGFELAISHLSKSTQTND